MEKRSAALAVMEGALPHVAFDGWSVPALEHGARAAGFGPEILVRLFPGGPLDALDLWLRDADRRMEEAYAALTPPPHKIRERIAALIRLRLEAYAPHKEAVRRALAACALPWHAHRGVAALARTVDAMWHAAGDAATDFNWYTKRALLAAVYSSTVLYWLNDRSADHAATWAFLDRRIDNVMQIGRSKQALKETFYKAVRR